MRPTLLSLHLGEREVGIHTYGLLVAVGFAAGIVLVWREGRRQGMNGARLLDLCFWSLVLGLGGSRLAYVVLHAGTFARLCSDGGLWGCTAALRFWEGGLIFYGGTIAAVATMVVFCRREGWSFGKVGDLFAPALAIGHVFGRLGCLAAGCCFGKACAAPWAVTFGPGSVAYEELAATGGLLGPNAPGAGGLLTPPLHPTQLYEALGELVILAGLLLLRRRARIAAAAAVAADGERARAAPRPGTLILAYAAAYAVLRLVIEVFRGDLVRGFVFTWASPRIATLLGLPAHQPLLLSTSQVASLLVLAAVAGAVLWRRGRR